ncbi:MAG: tetratricopeptide repeat protein [Myxococcota bacterium]
MRSLASRIGLGALCVSVACASPETARPLESELRPDGGFTLHERVRVSSRLRAEFERGVELVAAEQYVAGIEVLLRVTKAAPHLVAAHVDLGIAHARVGDLEEAETQLSRALELAPGHPVAENELGIVYRRTGRLAEARDSYESVLASYPAFHPARKNLAILCDLYLVDPDCALQHYAQYLEAVPDDAAAAMWVKDLRTRHGRE